MIKKTTGKNKNKNEHFNVRTISRIYYLLLESSNSKNSTRILLSKKLYTYIKKKDNYNNEIHLCKANTGKTKTKYKTGTLLASSKIFKL